MSQAAVIISKLKQMSGLHYDKDLAKHISELTGEKVSKQKISYWRESDNVDYALILKAFPDIDYNWLLKAEEFDMSTMSKETPTAKEPDGGYHATTSSMIIELPYYVQSVNSGRAVNLSAPSPANMKIPAGLLSGMQPAFAVLVAGNTMTSAGVIDGSTVICTVASGNYQDYAGKLVVMTVDGVTYLKRLVKYDDGSFALHSENGTVHKTEFYADIPLKEQSDISLHGVAVYIISLAM